MVSNTQTSLQSRKRNLTVPIQPQPNASHQTHNGSQLPVRAHTCCASRLLEPQNWSWSSRAYSREGPYEQHWTAFLSCVYIYNCVINLTFAYTCICTFSANCLLSPWHRVAVCDRHSKSARSKVWPRQLAHPTEHHSSMSDSCSFRIETSDIPDAKQTSFVSGPAVEMEHLALVWAHPYQWQNGSSCLLASTENIRKQWLIKRASNRDQLQMYLSWHSRSLSDIILQHLKSEEISLRMGPHHRHR